jgi:DNA repair protein RadC
MMLAHNHPSGNTHPSAHDRDLTQRLVEAARLFDIVILDHLIVTPDAFFSFADAGLL